MKINIILLHPRFALAISLFTCFGLVTPPSLRAQTFAGQSTLTDPPVNLRVIITPVSNSSIIRIRFENQGYGSVRLQIRDKKEIILLDESQPKHAYAGQYDLASLPPGLYTIELKTLDAHYTETIRIDSPTAGRVVMLSQQTEPTQKLIVKQ